MLRRAFLLVVAVTLLTSCKEVKQPFSESFYIFGTIVEVVILDEDRDKAKAAAAEVGVLFQELHKDWHAWKSGGELSKLNRAISKGTPLEVSPQLAKIVGAAKELHTKSLGLFDPAIGKVIGMWGFHADDLPNGPPPRDNVIAALLKSHPSMDDVGVDGNRVNSRNRDVAFDFGGFAKGAAIDLAISILKKHHVTSAIVNAGGDLNVLGDHGDRPWRIAIRDPIGWGAVASLEAKAGEAIYTSGNYERYRKADGLRFSHIIDPRNFRPVQDIVSATVVHHNGALADAAATALSVAGRSSWRQVAKSMGIDLALLITADGSFLMTPQMKARLGFEDAEPAKIVVSDLQ